MSRNKCSAFHELLKSVAFLAFVFAAVTINIAYHASSSALATYENMLGKNFFQAGFDFVELVGDYSLEFNDDGGEEKEWINHSSILFVIFSSFVSANISCDKISTHHFLCSFARGPPIFII